MPVKRTKAFKFDALVAKLGSGATSLNVEDKHHIYTLGDVADSAFYVRMGQVMLSVVSKSGKEAVIGICGTGQFFGESCLTAGHSKRYSNASSVGPSTVVRLEKKLVLQLLRDDPEFADSFVSFLVKRTQRVEEDLIDQLFNSSEKRLARILLLLANFGTEEEPPLILPQLSQETLAQMIGASRPRVSQFLNKFRDLGFIEYNGVLRVHKSLLQVVLRD